MDWHVQQSVYVSGVSIFSLLNNTTTYVNYSGMGMDLQGLHFMWF